MFQRVVVPCVAVVVVGLSGCGGGSSSSAAAESSAVRASGVAGVARAAALSTSSSSGVSKPVSASTPAVVPLVDAKGSPIIPAAARAHTDAGAIAFTKYYWALLADFDTRPRDPYALRVLSARDCDIACRKEQEAIKRLVQEGARFEGVKQALSDFQTVPGGGGKTVVAFLLEQEGGERISRGKSTNLDAYRLDMNAIVRWQDDGWKIVAVHSSAH